MVDQIELSDVALEEGHSLLEAAPGADRQRLCRAVLTQEIFDTPLFGFNRFYFAGVPKTIGEIQDNERNGDRSQGLLLLRIVRNQRHRLPIGRPLSSPRQRTARPWWVPRETYFY